ncbi:YbaB/EbfC family nucleoid-associated protein [Allokutzneria oryzae]|uniref:YbaB/EbfC family nucleoid-associated protein n=1 Tax=Allokutzneria oryzae TaxID=1378989 RepID=A0ABV5ZUW8_9PSEU
MTVPEPSTAELIAAAEQRQLQAAEVERAMAAVTGTATGADGMVSATVTARGRLVGLRLHPDAVRLGPALGDAIVDVARRAADDAAQRSYNVLAPVLGDELTAAIEAMAGPVPERARTSESVPVSWAPMGTAGDSGGEEDEDDVLTFDASSLRSDR